MTTSPSSPKSEIWRRRLRPAAPLVVPAYTTAVAMLAIAIPGGPRSDEPPVGRALPAMALAAEQPPPSPPSRPAPRRLVDVVDREAARPRHIDIPAIGVSAAVIPLGLEPDGTMQTPANWLPRLRHSLAVDQAGVRSPVSFASAVMASTHASPTRRRPNVS